MSARILLALGIGVALAGCTGGVGDSPSKVVDAFMAASKAKDGERVKRYLTKESIATYERGEAIRKGADEKEPRGTWKILKEEVKGDAAEVTLQMENLGEGPETAQMIVVCVRRAGRWLIDLDKTREASVRKGYPMMLEEAAKEEAGKEEAGGAPAAKAPSGEQIRKALEALKAFEKPAAKRVPAATEPAAGGPAEETEPEGGEEKAIEGVPSEEEVKAAAKAMEALGEMFKKAMEEAAKKGGTVPPSPETEEK